MRRGSPVALCHWQASFIASKRLAPLLCSVVRVAVPALVYSLQAIAFLHGIEPAG